MILISRNYPPSTRGIAHLGGIEDNRKEAVCMGALTAIKGFLVEAAVLDG